MFNNIQLPEKITQLYDIYSALPKQCTSLLKEGLKEGLIKAFHNKDLARRAQGIIWEFLGTGYMGGSSYLIINAVIIGSYGVIATIGFLALGILGILAGCDLVQVGSNLLNNNTYERYSSFAALMKANPSNYNCDSEEKEALAGRNPTELDKWFMQKMHIYLIKTEKTVIFEPTIIALRDFTLSYDLVNKIHSTFWKLIEAV